MSRNLKIAILFVTLSVLVPLLLTIAVGDDGLNMYFSYFGLMIIGIPCAIIALILFVLGKYLYAMALFSIILSFIVLDQMIPVAAFFYHQRNFDYAKDYCNKLIPYLDNYKAHHNKYPMKIHHLDTDIAHTPYAIRMFQTNVYKFSNVFIDYTSDGDSFAFIVCPADVYSEYTKNRTFMLPEIQAQRSYVLSSKTQKWQKFKHRIFCRENLDQEIPYGKSQPGNN